MGALEEAAARARQRPDYIQDSNYRPRHLVRQRTPTFNPRPNFGGGGAVTPPAGRRGGLTAEQILSMPGTDQSGGGGGSSPFGLVGKGLMEILNVADMPRRAYQSVAGELGDVTAGALDSMGIENKVVQSLVNAATGNPFQLRGLADEEGNRDTSFDFGEIRRGVTGDDAWSQGFMGRTTWDDSIDNPLIRGAIGIAGDLATDPLTYATGGLAKGATATGRAAGREVLATNIARATAAAENVGDDVLAQAGKRLGTEAGKRGRGALTDQGLRRAGVTRQQALELGVDVDFGVHAGVRGMTAKLPGTRAIAESAENLKGTIKAATGASKPGRLSRELFTSYKNGERKMRQAVLSGAPDSATMARGLAVLNESKATSWRWLDDNANTLKNLNPEGGKKLSRYSKREAEELTRALDAGDLSDPMAAQLNDFFRNVAADLQERGVQFSVRKNYVPHRLSEKAQRMFERGDESVMAVVKDKVDKEEVFQRLRDDARSITEINAEWNAKHGYDLLETDMRTLASQYLGEGQQAVMRAGMVGDTARKLNLVDDAGRAVNDEGAKAVRKLLKAESDAVARSVGNKRKALNRATKAARKTVSKKNEELTLLKGQAAAANDSVGTAAERLGLAQDQMRSAQEVADLRRGIANKARGAEKGRAQQALARAEAKLEEAQKNLVSRQNGFNASRKNRAEMAERLEQAKIAFAQANESVDQLRLFRKNLDEAPQATDAVAMQKAADEAAEKAAKARETFVQAENEFRIAEKTAQFLKADMNHVQSRAKLAEAEFDDWMERVERSSAKTKKGTPEQAAQRESMREQMSEARKFLEDAEGTDMEFFARMEWQGIEADAAAMRAGRSGRKLQSQFDEMDKILDDPEFAKYMVDVANDGFDLIERRFGPTMQIDSSYRDAIETIREFNANPNEFLRAFRFSMRKWKKAMNWWKGWALASPGFVVRNMYSGMFGMYLDNINPNNSVRFMRYLQKFESEGAEAAQAWARQKYKDVGAAQLNEAHRVATASGWGITADEVSRNLAGDKINWWNPLSSNSPLPRFAQWGGRHGEAALRGGHALGVLRRGGNFDEALSRVQKFHFNYRDIAEGDYAMKQVMPFWMFFSRNLGLQAQVYAKQPNKITRSYYNAKRNIEGMTEDSGAPVPSWLMGQQAIRGAGEMLFNPDIPSVRAPQMFDELSPFAPEGEGGGFNPMRSVESLLGNTSPGVKIPAQLAANKNFFLDREYRNNLTTYSDEGEIPRYAPAMLQQAADVPGVGNLMGLLPGTEYIDGELLMQDNVQDVVKDIAPVQNRLTRLLPGLERYRTDRENEKFGQSWASFLGAPIVWNDEGSQAGAMAQARREQEEAARKVQERIRLENLVSRDR